ncbi:MAG: A24 family peptidase [Gammaproteobacteria bacterium]|nr:A24 family peptidase [Gammaproteobacteria bacterium]MCI0591768.1 A24 family peptidase [Gammaproteobacteria bacterium]
MSIIAYLEASPVAFAVSTGIMGLIVGSFLNVVIHRLPKMMERDWRSQCVELLAVQEPVVEQQQPYNLVHPGSHCPKCGHAITALENIPIISYLVQGGRCSACHAHISVRYPAVELLSGVLAAFAAWHFGLGWQAVGAALLTWSLVALSFIDVDHQLLPDPITLPFVWLGLAFNLFGIFTDVQSSLIGAMAGYSVLWLIYILFKLLTGKEGMGYGDFKLLAMLGAWLGWQMLPLIIMGSALVGAIIGLSLIVLQGRDKTKPIPFGPYLACAGWIALIWGSDFTEAYLTWASPS